MTSNRSKTSPTLAAGTVSTWAASDRSATAGELDCGLRLRPPLPGTARVAGGGSLGDGVAEGARGEGVPDAVDGRVGQGLGERAKEVVASGAGPRRSGSSAPTPWRTPSPAPDAPFTVDQASSSTAFVSVRDAAARGSPLPEGWVVDADGRPTTDPETALTGALLPFGGYKGANIALLVELLSSMAGGRWSVDAPPWDSGSRSPSVGMFAVGIDHSAIGPEFPARAEEHLERLAGSGVRLPGSRRTEPSALPTGYLALRADVLIALRRRAGLTPTASSEGGLS